MKTIIRIFNIVFVAISALAIVLLVALPTVSLNVSYTITAEQITKVIPENETTKDIDFKEVLGGEKIVIGLSLSVTPKALGASVTGNSKEVIDKEFIDPNIESVTNTLRDPIHRVAKGVAKQLLVKVLIQQFEDIINENKGEDSRSATQIRNASGLDDNYFKGFTEELFVTIDKPNATISGAVDVMFDKLSDAVTRISQESSGIEIPEIDSTYKSSIQSSLITVLDDANLLKEDGETLYSFDTIIDGLLVDLLRQSGSGNEAPEGETMEEKAAQLQPTLAKLIKGVFTDEMYDVMATVLKVMLIVLIVLIAVWAFFLVFTLLKTILGRKKMWTFTGPHFWIAGVIQLVLGIGLTIATSVLLSSTALANMMPSGSENALAGISASVVTSCFIPSILVLIMIPLTIVYLVFKHKVKVEYKKELAAQKAQ